MSTDFKREKSLTYTQKNFKNDDEDDDQNFIKLGEEAQKIEAIQQSTEFKQLITKLKAAILPNTIKQRDLDLEVGGLESKKSAGKDSATAQENSNETEASADDVWDERSEEIQDMNVDVFNSTGMKSVVWKKKKDRIEEKKEMIQDSIEQAAMERAARRKTSFADKVTQSRQNLGNSGRGL